MSRSLVTLAVGLATAALAGAAISAYAAKPVIHSTLTLEHEQTQTGHIFSGRVESRRRKCERNRTVGLYATSGSQLVGKPVKTTRRGRWQVQLPGDFLAGSFYAKAKRKKTRRFRCGADRSNVITIP